MKNTKETFNNLIKDQFQYGGKKYASKNKKKEATDILFDKHSHRWLVGTIDKYTHRYKNLARERDLLKIATYMYILWLKRGYHLSPKGSRKVINTEVKVKIDNFPTFISKLDEAKLIIKCSKAIDYISNFMENWSKCSFSKINEKSIFIVYQVTYQLWLKDFSHIAGQDKDTWNEQTSLTLA